jgi:hypothetical protein
MPPVRSVSQKKRKRTSKPPRFRKQATLDQAVLTKFKLQRAAEGSFFIELAVTDKADIYAQPQAVLACGANELVEGATLVTGTFPRWPFAGGTHDFLVDRLDTGP